VAQFGYYRPSLVFYTRQRIDGCGSPEEVQRYLASGKNAFVVTTSWHLEQQLADLPRDIVVLGQHDRFPKNGSVLVLGSRTAHLARFGELPQRR
jgi:hypothetical protein